MTQRVTFRSSTEAPPELINIGAHLPRVEFLKAFTAVRPEHKRRCLIELKRAFEYFLDATEQAIPLTPVWQVKINISKMMEANGAQMHVPASWLEEAERGEMDPRYLTSTFIHEVIHSFGDGETFPMFLEFIYHLETGDTQHVIRNAGHYRTRHDPEGLMGGEDGAPYAFGYEQIARLIGCEPEELHLVMPKIPVPELKRLFTAELARYIRDVPEEERCQ